MRNRRDFLKNVAGATAGAFVAGGSFADVALGSVQAPATRRRAMIGGRRITVVDIHAHHFVPEVIDIVRGTPLEAEFKGQAGTKARYLGPGWFQYMDKEGIDVSVLNMNPWWYAADRDLARRVCDFQNEKTAEWVKRYPDRFVGMATCALQHPDRKFDPFWAKAEQLGVMLFMHPQQAPGTTDNKRLGGKGALGNTIGNPLETTVFLSHLIFEGTLDRFPGLKICAAHAGGYLPSYLGRSDARCGRGGGQGDCVKLKPSEYFRRNLYIDSMIFREEGLRNLVAEVGHEHMFYGTDFPFDWPVGIDFILNAKVLNDAQKEAILGGNLVKLLGIKPVSS